jgi:hypothetical protein
MTSYSGIRPTAASCVCSVKKRTEILLCGILPKCIGLHCYSIQKRCIYKRFEETVYPCAAHIGMDGMRIEKEPRQRDEYVYRIS